MSALEESCVTLKFYNTLTRQKETFEPLDWSNKAIAESDKKVRLYVCGPTVYDDAHIGNARPILVFDVLTRLLRHHYGPDHVTYVRNITDVDDKINARAHQEKIDIRQLTEQTARQFHEDIEALGALKPDVEPRATDHIPQMIDMINRLVLKNYAYEAKGHILFHVPSMKDYGSFSGRSTDEMVAGARVEVAPYKKNPMDFVLWKPSGGDEPGWESPWGRGRPGWHIECSAMSKHYLGEQFDIHGGGIDLLFPHHENEIAQSRCAHGSPMMAKLWMHNGYLQIEGEKMSKSSGNFITIRNLLRKWPGEAIRLAMLSTHYRQPINWTEKNLSEAKKNLDHWIQLTAESDPSPILCADFHAALKDDLNTPQAITVLHELRREARRSRAAAACLKSCAGLIGLLQKGTKEWAAWRPASLTINESQIEALIEDRLKARDEKNWAEADQIRDRLTTMGITLKDGPEGTCWKVIE